MIRTVEDSPPPTNLTFEEALKILYTTERKLRVEVEGDIVDLRKVIIVDNMPENFGLQPANGIPIKGWYNDCRQDCELLKLSNIL